MRELVAIALSGGIDSLVAAALLKEQGYPLIGLHFLTGFESGFRHLTPPPLSDTHLSRLKAQLLGKLTPMAEQLDIPIRIIDLRPEFQSMVVNYFTATYQGGKTPNPCLVCNPLIKFNILFKKAQTYGAVKIATGHYARIELGNDGLLHLLRGVDPVKEQSYFLSRLSQVQLHRAIFPLGGYTKSQTRRMALQRSLRPVFIKESQDICFIANGSYSDFLKQQPGFASSPGAIENLSGQQIGRHSGLHQFTIGQRRGINCPAADPYYVIRIDAGRNALIVGSKRDLFSQHIQVEQISWTNSPPRAPMRVLVRVRYRHAAVPAMLIVKDETHAEITFEAPQSAVTPGQGAVFYCGEEVLGGGWIR